MDRIITRLGLTEDDPELLHDRRGTTVYKIGATALKITSGLMAAREGEILRLLGNQTYRAHGWDGERSWLTLRWINGTGLWNALEHVHRGEDSTATRHHMLVMTADAARELADLHAAGWVHGDLQPDHVTTTPQADVWSLGASLWWSWTRTTPIAYADPAAGRTALLTDIRAMRRHSDHSAVRPWPFPAFEEAVLACLAAHPEDRPTAEELATNLP